MKRFLDYQDSARRRLPHFFYEYINGGSYDEATMRSNVARLAEITLRQRAMIDVSSLSTECRFFGKKSSLPIVLGPVGLAGMMARRGETQAARAATKVGIPYCMSTYAVCSIAEVGAAVQAPFWFQLNFFKDRGLVTELMREASKRCSVLILSGDLAALGTRYSDFRSGLAAPGVIGKLRRFGQALMRPAWSWNVGVLGRPHVLGNIQPYLDSLGVTEDPSSWTKRNLDPSATWQDLAWMRDKWNGPLIVKGILDPDDAQMAMDIGATGIVVSNHGGRQLDGVMATADALPRIAERIGERGTIFVDGGVRSGLDVLKMITLGAHGVLLGRAWVTALAAGGEAAVSAMLNNMASELRFGMSMTGLRTIPAGRGVAWAEPRCAKQRDAELPRTIVEQ